MPAQYVNRKKIEVFSSSNLKRIKKIYKMKSKANKISVVYFLPKCIKTEKKIRIRQHRAFPRKALLL